MAALAIAVVHRGHGARGRDQPVRDERHHAIRLVAVSEEQKDRRAKLAIAGVIAIGVLLRLLVVRSPGFPSDVGTFQAWALRLAELGPGRFYEPGYFSDYPPGYLYVLWLFGGLLGGGPLLNIVLKAMSVPAGIGIGVVASSLVWRSRRTYAVLAAAVWMLSPGPIFAGPYWGQVDAVGTLPLMAALVLAGRGRWATAGAVAGLAAMVKPQFGIAAIVVIAAAVIVWIRGADWRPSLRSLLGTVGAVLLLGLPFRAGPGELIDLVKSAAATYPFRSLYAFNVWSIVGDFWKPDDAFVATGIVLVLAGLLGSCALLWRRRDVPVLLAAGALAAMAFYFLPTRAHERYLFPAFALLLPLAAVRARLLWPYVGLSVALGVSLYFAFTRYPQNDLRSPEWLEQTLFTRNGQIAIALVMLGIAAYVAWRLWRGDATLEADLDRGDLPSIAGEAVGQHEESPPERPAGRLRLPDILALGGPPTRRDLAVAFLIALVVLGTRGFRLDQPRDMYFDEVYHARTAFEFLAQREPYEWTHPHLAKEIMALGILAFGDDHVVGTERGVAASAFAVTNDGLRVYLTNGVLTVIDRPGRRRDPPDRSAHREGHADRRGARSWWRDRVCARAEPAVRRAHRHGRARRDRSRRAFERHGPAGQRPHREHHRPCDGARPRHPNAVPVRPHTGQRRGRRDARGVALRRDPGGRDGSIPGHRRRGRQAPRRRRRHGRAHRDRPARAGVAPPRRRLRGDARVLPRPAHASPLRGPDRRVSRRRGGRARRLDVRAGAHRHERHLRDDVHRGDLVLHRRRAPSAPLRRPRHRARPRAHRSLVPVHVG